jgi:hypothetical protein
MNVKGLAVQWEEEQHMERKKAETRPMQSIISRMLGTYLCRRCQGKKIPDLPLELYLGKLPRGSTTILHTPALLATSQQTHRFHTAITLCQMVD